MKWETVQETVASGVRQLIIEQRSYEIYTTILRDMIASGKFGLSRDITPAYADFAYDTIMQWDIRCVERLRELFCGFFPKSLRKGRLAASLEETGWEVIAIKGVQHAQTNSC